MAVSGRKRDLIFSQLIDKKVREAVKQGVSIKDLMASIQHLQQAPSSTNQLYKYYGQSIAEEKVKVIGDIGNVVIAAARGGDLKAAEFFLRSKGGWSPNSTVNVDEVNGDPDEDTSAIDDLLTLMGLDSTSEEDPEISPVEATTDDQAPDSAK